jgi:hypothetical protein
MGPGMAAATAIRIGTRDVVQRVFALSEGADGAHRSWIMLFPLGEYKHESYGKLNFTRERLSEIKRKFDSRVRYIDIALDADHAAAKGDTRATGWIERLELREQVPDAAAPGGTQPGGLWGLIKWTPYGLTMLRADEYRYFSPEFGPWKDPISGRVFKDVLCGGGLTNRPFLKNMGPVMLSELQGRRRLAEVSTKPWGSVDKAKLPDSAFLDSTNRRLPIYEGTGDVGADGRYTQRGPLNIHGAEAALAAIHGARSGKPMSGVPAGAVARLKALIAKHKGTSLAERAKRITGQGGPKAKMETRTELPDGTVRIKRGPSPEDIARDEQESARRLAERGERETAKARRDAKALLAEYEQLTSASDDDDLDDDGGELNATLRELRGQEDESEDEDAFTLDDSMGDSASDAGDETYDEDDDDGDDEHEEDLPEPPMPKKGKGGKSKAGKGKQLAQRANVKGAGGMSSKTCAEIAAQPHTLTEARSLIFQLAEEREATRKLLHEHAVKDELASLKIGALTLSEATAGTKREQLAKAKLGLSKRFSDLYQEVLGAEGVGYLLDENSRGDIRELVKTALSFAVVDLAQRGSGFDMEQRKTRRSGDAKRRQAEGGYATLAEETVTLAEEKSVDLNELRRLAGAGNVKAKQELRKHLYEASARSGYGRD